MTEYTKSNLVEDLLLHDLFADAPKYKVKAFVEDLFSLISTKVSLGQTVSIPGFGKFKNFTRSNGAKTPKFRPSTRFRSSVGKDSE